MKKKNQGGFILSKEYIQDRRSTNTSRHIIKVDLLLAITSRLYFSTDFTQRQFFFFLGLLINLLFKVIIVFKTICFLLMEGILGWEEETFEKKNVKPYNFIR